MSLFYEQSSVTNINFLFLVTENFSLLYYATFIPYTDTVLLQKLNTLALLEIRQNFIPMLSSKDTRPPLAPLIWSTCFTVASPPPDHETVFRDPSAPQLTQRQLSFLVALLYALTIWSSPDVVSYPFPFIVSVLYNTVSSLPPRSWNPFHSQGGKNGQGLCNFFIYL